MKPLVSVVIEHQTAELSTAPHVIRNLREVTAQLAALPAPGGEVILVSAHPVIDPPAGVRCLLYPGQSYYSLKNAGMREARAEIVIFTDADCRLGPGYIQRVLFLFNTRPELHCLAGRSNYDGTGFLARMNTALSFGYLHNPQTHSTKPYGILAHNVAIRADSAPEQPFGPFTGRVAGDTWMTEWYTAQGTPPYLDGELVVFHEDPSFSVVLRMDRQLREVLQTIRHASDLRPWRLGAWIAMGKAVLSPLWRARKLVRFGGHLGLGYGSLLLAMPVLLLYGLADVLAVLAMILVPGLGDRWIRYQNG